MDPGLRRDDRLGWCTYEGGAGSALLPIVGKAADDLWRVRGERFLARLAAPAGPGRHDEMPPSTNSGTTVNDSAVLNRDRCGGKALFASAERRSRRDKP